MEYTETGRRLKARRQELDISAVELAGRLGLSKATVHRYENGDIQNIKLPVVSSIAKELHVNPLWLLGKSERKEADKKDEDDLLDMVDALLEYAKNAPSLTAGGKTLTREQRRIVTTSLGFTRTFLSEIE